MGLIQVTNLRALPWGTVAGNIALSWTNPGVFQQNYNGIRVQARRSGDSTWFWLWGQDHEGHDIDLTSLQVTSSDLNGTNYNYYFRVWELWRAYVVFYFVDEGPKRNVGRVWAGLAPELQTNLPVIASPDPTEIDIELQNPNYVVYHHFTDRPLAGYSRRAEAQVRAGWRIGGSASAPPTLFTGWYPGIRASPLSQRINGMIAGFTPGTDVHIRSRMRYRSPNNLWIEGDFANATTIVTPDEPVEPEVTRPPAPNTPIVNSLSSLNQIAVYVTLNTHSRAWRSITWDIDSSDNSEDYRPTYNLDRDARSDGTRTFEIDHDQSKTVRVRCRVTNVDNQTSFYSPTSTLVISAADPMPTPQEVRPSRPSSFTADSADNQNFVDLAWVRPATGSGTIWYNLWRKKSSEPDSAYTENRLSPSNGLFATSYRDDSGLEFDTPYRYRLQAENLIGVSPTFAYVDVRTSQSPILPSPPATDIIDADSLNMAVRLQWVRSPVRFAVSGYDVRYKPISSDDWIFDDLGEGITSVATARTIDELVNDILYEFQVRAQNENASPGTWSTSARATPVAPPPSVFLPHDPTDITAEPASGAILIAWTETEPDATHSPPDLFQIHLAYISGGIVLSDESYRTDGHAITISGLLNGRTYRVRVRARNAQGFNESDYLPNPPLQVTPQSNLDRIVRTVPSQPFGFGGVPLDEGTQLDWRAPNDGGSPLTHYDVRYSFQGPSEASTVLLEGVVPGNGLSYTILNLVNGIIYSVQVRAANIIGDGLWSSVLEITPNEDGGSAEPQPLPPSAPGLVGIPRDRAVELNLTPPDFNGGSLIIDYDYEYTPLSGRSAGIFVEGKTRSSLRYTILGLRNGQRYSFRALAQNEAGAGPWSPYVYVIPSAAGGNPTPNEDVPTYDTAPLLHFFNTALSLAGIARMQDINEDTPQGIACRELFPALYRKYLGLANWQFATRRIKVKAETLFPDDAPNYTYSIDHTILGYEETLAGFPRLDTVGLSTGQYRYRLPRDYYSFDPNLPTPEEALTELQSVRLLEIVIHSPAQAQSGDDENFEVAAGDVISSSGVISAQQQWRVEGDALLSSLNELGTLDVNLPELLPVPEQADEQATIAYERSVADLETALMGRSRWIPEVTLSIVASVDIRYATGSFLDAAREALAAKVAKRFRRARTVYQDLEATSLVNLQIAIESEKRQVDLNAISFHSQLSSQQNQP